jgi:hypothetical protein
VPLKPELLDVPVVVWATVGVLAVAVGVVCGEMGTPGEKGLVVSGMAVEVLAA